MILTYTPERIAEICGGVLAVPGNRIVTNVCTDSREAGSGSLFCAIAGERTDGHRYIAQVCASGAACILAERMPENGTDLKGTAVVLVPQTIHAIGDLAADYRDHADVRVVAVTGSVGKTTTKDFIASVAAIDFKTYKTQGNHNNELGLSMTIFGMDPEDRVAVLEMGMSAFGEIERMSHIARPDIAVITNIGTAHLAYLGSRENITRAKMEIAAGMTSEGILLLNADEPLLYARANTTVPKTQLTSIDESWGDYRAVNVRAPEDGMVYDLICRDSVVTNVRIPTLGMHNVRNSLVAYAVGYILGMSEEHIREGLMSFSGTEMRQNIYEFGSMTIIEDCYNASPESMRAALDVLAGMAAKKNARSAALLGDMLELGDYSRLMHDQLGQYAARVKVGLLFCYGRFADVVAEAAITHGIRAENVYVSLDANDPQTMADMIRGAIRPGDILLVKASRGVAAEKVLECLKKKKRK